MVQNIILHFSLFIIHSSFQFHVILEVEEKKYWIYLVKNNVQAVG